jgi:hypothetical protein
MVPGLRKYRKYGRNGMQQISFIWEGPREKTSKKSEEDVKIATDKDILLQTL